MVPGDRFGTPGLFPGWRMEWFRLLPEQPIFGSDDVKIENKVGDAVRDHEAQQALLPVHQAVVEEPAEDAHAPVGRMLQRGQHRGGEE